MHASWWTSIRAFFGTKIFRELVLVSFILGLYAVFVNYVEHLIFHKDLNFATTITGLFGATISILMVYRTNGAYDRWWEGRKVWGQLVNECRNLVVKTCALSKVPVEEKRAMQELVAAFPPALRDHLRGCRTKDSIVPEGVVHGPAYVTEEVFKKLQSWRDCGSLDDFAFLALDEHALSLLNVCGMCERIQKTPLPLSHRALIPQLLFLYLLLLPWSIEYHAGAIFVVMVLGYFLVGLELIADRLECPFQTVDDGLPLDSLCEGIAASTREVVERQISKARNVDTESVLC